VDCDPLAALEPAQAPEAVQAVALVADQLKVELEPLVILLGFAASMIEGAEEFTDTVADCDALPPDPEHVSVNVELAPRAPVDCEPVNVLPPDHAPEAVQVRARLADQVRVEDWPELSVLGPAVSCTTGDRLETVTVADCVAEPPGPVQVSSYSVVLVSAPVAHVPVSGTVPLQPPAAVQLVAFAAFHVKVELPPLPTVVGEAVKVTAALGTVTSTLTD
jgi:hypothetical protein